MAELSPRQTIDAEPTSAAVQQLPEHHLQVLVRAIQNVLSSPIAETTFGEIIDGLPLSETATNAYNRSLCPGHPLMAERFALSPGATDKVQKLRGEFQPPLLRADAKVLHDYQTAPVGSRTFNARLIELVAIAVHSIAVWLFKQESVLKNYDELMSWRPDEGLSKRCYPDGFPATFFQHEWYRDYSEYPDGIADQVGYWAESRILGGVVLFDRCDPDVHSDVDPNAIYLHPDREGVTYRIFKITDEQKHELLMFLSSDATPPPTCPLPILGTDENRVRVDPEEPIEETGIYRDIWERKPRNPAVGDARFKTVVDRLNYLTRDEQSLAMDRAERRRYPNAGAGHR